MLSNREIFDNLQVKKGYARSGNDLYGCKLCGVIFCSSGKRYIPSTHNCALDTYKHWQEKHSFELMVVEEDLKHATN